MARIRSIKPELLEDEKTATLSHLEWRLFVSAILLADDYGNFRASPARVSGVALWAHREDVGPALDALESAGLIVRYTVDGQAYAHISGWEKHQKVDHPGKPSCPGQEKVSRNPRESLAETARESRLIGSGSEGIGSDLSPPEGAPAIPGTTEQAPRGTPPTTTTPSRVLELWGEARLAEFGGHPFDTNGHGIKSEAAREAAELVNATMGAAAHVAESMRRFWRAVKTGEHDKAAEVARKPSFAFACWLAQFPGDFEELSGCAPEIPKRDRAGPAGRQPSTATRDAFAEILNQGKS